EPHALCVHRLSHSGAARRPARWRRSDLASHLGSARAMAAGVGMRLRLSVFVAGVVGSLIMMPGAVLTRDKMPDRLPGGPAAAPRPGAPRARRRRDRRVAGDPNRAALVGSLARRPLDHLHTFHQPGREPPQPAAPERAGARPERLMTAML